MKKIGLIGGITYQSTALYYKYINDRINERLGGIHSAQLLLYSFDFAEVEQLQRSEDWAEAAARFAQVGQWLKDGGAELIVICANTMHIVADELERATGLPLLHIADVTAADIAAKKAGCKTVGLLGTRYTMQKPFLRDRLRDRHGYEVLVPDEESIQVLYRIILDELTLGIVRQESRAVYQQKIKELQARGAEAIILGCTEIPMLISQEDTELPVINTTRIHAIAAADWAIDSPQVLLNGTKISCSLG